MGWNVVFNTEDEMEMKIMGLIGFDAWNGIFIQVFGLDLHTIHGIGFWYSFLYMAKESIVIDLAVGLW